EPSGNPLQLDLREAIVLAGGRPQIFQDALEILALELGKQIVFPQPSVSAKLTQVVESGDQTVKRLQAIQNVEIGRPDRRVFAIELKAGFKFQFRFRQLVSADQPVGPIEMRVDPKPSQIIGDSALGLSCLTAPC